jgi:hypothetical protein
MAVPDVLAGRAEIVAERTRIATPEPVDIGKADRGQGAGAMG